MSASRRRNSCRQDRFSFSRKWLGAGFDDFLAWQKDLAFSISLRLEDNWLVKAEIHSMDGAGLLDSDNNPELQLYPGRLEQDWLMYMFKVSYFF